MSRRSSRSGSAMMWSLGAILLAGLLAGCGSSAASTTPGGTAAVAATETAASSATASESTASGGMQVRFGNLTDGGTAPASLDTKGRPLVAVKIEVSGGIPFSVSLIANGLPAVDEGGHQIMLENTAGVTPFSAEITWSPLNGGGDYTLIATAMDANKNLATATIHVTVTGVPHTTLPPALTADQARTRVTDLIANEYRITIPKPSLQRFDYPENPTRSRWIGAAYYQGIRYYVSIFDDGHVEWANGPYSDPAHRSSNVYMCRPASAFKVLVVFVDYGNTGTVKADALAEVPVVATWLNGLYEGFATSQGFSSAPMSVQADAAWVASPPKPNELLTASQIRTLTGKDTSGYDFTMQIDLDVNGGWGVHENPGFMQPGGGFALNGCGVDVKIPTINVWSSVTAAQYLQGGLAMDFNHELSHLFGMMDDWPYKQGVAGPDGNPIDDWIPYVMFGWTDTDGDGVPEILDPTPYGTSGPKP